MAEKKVFVCQECGATSPKWIGRCPSCNNWNTYQEETVVKKKGSVSRVLEKALLISEVSETGKKRLELSNKEVNRILGGGIVPGTVVLIGGEPGIGKSTLLLQVALENPEVDILYISGEESLEQIKFRAGRISPNGGDCYVLNETNLEAILEQIKKIKPQIVIVDSIQTVSSDNVESAPGTITQIRQAAMEFQQLAKAIGVSVFIIGHINKDGHLAGPKVLEHIVDAVLFFEGENHLQYRMLRSAKNRYGSTSELALYEMTESGLKEVLNPSEFFMDNYHTELSGGAIASTINGNRPILVEVQALVSSAVYSAPQRVSTGFDQRRLSMLLAVLEKRAAFRMLTKDVFINLAGGIKLNDPGLDLAVIASVLSSDQNKTVGKDLGFAGEVGLTGEIRPVSKIEARIKEAERLGLSTFFVSEYSGKNLSGMKANIDLVFVKSIGDLLKKLF